MRAADSGETPKGANLSVYQIFGSVFNWHVLEHICLRFVIIIPAVVNFIAWILFKQTGVYRLSTVTVGQYYRNAKHIQVKQIKLELEWKTLIYFHLLMTPLVK